ncbi:MAG: GreA/GreB family elongation factor [Clostridia bacterium]|nr:GreA/GreB family elongation factor [Clostridia bacterium]
MMKYSLSKTVFEKLLKQLVAIEEKANLIKYFDSNSNQSEFAEIMELYTLELSEFIEFATQIESDNTSVPFVVIGSDVKVRDLDSNELSIYHITTPEVYQAGENDVTLLSPIGKALLMKEAGVSVDIKIPSGMIHYRIESINLNSEIDIENLFSYANK